MVYLDFLWGTGKDIQLGLLELEKEDYFKMAGGEFEVKLAFLAGKDKGYSIDKVGNDVQIAYKTTSDFYFALSLLLANKDEFIYKVEGKNSFDGVYLLLDCSRNAVRSVSELKQLINKLVLLGYKGMYLYIEDTYIVDNEPYFGYQRGAYTKEELKEIVDYSEKFNFEIIPAIQTLAHLSTMLRWDTYYEIADTQDILMVGSQRTYKLIENMLLSLSQVFKTKKINLGMDEAHFIGLGGYLNFHGYKDRKELMLEHIRKVLELCKKYNFVDVRIWSDMLIKKYVKEEQDCLSLFECILEGIDGIKLTPIFWDYYEKDYEFYKRNIKIHSKLTDKTIFTCGGGYTWFGYAPLNRYAMEINKNAIKCAKKYNVSELVVADWYDGGAEGSLYAGISSTIDCGCYNYFNDNKKIRNDISKIVTGYSLLELMSFDYPNLTYDIKNKNEITSSSKYLLYGDILNGTFEKNINEQFPGYYNTAINKLKPLAKDNRKYNYAFNVMLKLAEFLKIKIEIQLNIRDYYKNNKEGLNSILVKIKKLIKKGEEFYLAVMEQWKKENKPFGNEVLSVKLGGMIARLKYTEDKIKKYLNGTIIEIEELEKEVLPYMTIANYDFIPNDKEKCNMVAFCFRELTTSGVF